MVCIHCGSNTRIINSRPQKRTNQVWRRHSCLTCGSIVSSLEAIDFATALRVRNKASGLVPLVRDRLFLSLYKSLSHRSTAISDANGLTATVLAKVTPQASLGVVDSNSIKQAVIVALNRFDKAAATHYQAFHKS